MEYITCAQAPAAIGPYSHAIVAKNFIFMSGQLGLDPATMLIVPGVEAQTHLIFKNIIAILATADKSLADIVKTTIFLTNMDDFCAVNSIYANYFGNHRPARSCIEVRRLPKNGLIEIECIAV